MKPRRDRSLTLIFDADDTLWHSNIHFLEAEAEFAAAIAQAGLITEREHLRALMRECESRTITSHGYGRGPYARAMAMAVEMLSELEEFRHRMTAEVERIGRNLLQRHCELMPDVERTLVELGRRHRLGLLTKGQCDEQLGKLARSGLEQLFDFVEVVAEKDDATYQSLIHRRRLAVERTFMIGNSPRSDINPALRAGLGAVYIPYEHTWTLEMEEVPAGASRLYTVRRLRELLSLF